MKNKYRINFINNVLTAVDADEHVDGERLAKAIDYVKDGIRILDEKAERLAKKELKELQKANVEADKQLAEVE